MSNLEQGDAPSKELTAQLEHDAHRAVEAEHKMSLWQSLKTYPHAAGWSILLSTAIIMEGYDTCLISNLYAYEPFQRTYGVKGADGKYQLTPAWQSGLSNGALVGEILGLMLNGIIAERFGYRKSLIGALMLCIAFTFIIFFSASLPVLLVGEILIGIPWGVFQTITTTYAAEVCPVVLRPYLTTYVNLCWVFGQLIASVSDGSFYLLLLSNNLIGCFESNANQNRRMGLQDSFRAAVDVASASYYWDCTRSRISLVAGTQGPS